ncbi:hypothetical protein ACFYUY_04640 [Kitasatospora sp. NPDC004745]|uniref:hypothetical protein n=1 Tax=Kitasatospora sp. NPDC004745 TaxID=3364019 RepID=UPI00367FDA0E
MPVYRYFTTDALTGEVLAHDLPLSGVSYGPERNGPGQLRGVLEPRLAHLAPSQAEAGTVLLWAERDQRLMWGGLIWHSKPEGDQLIIEAAGFGSYPTRRFDLHGNLGGRGPYPGVDPCTVIADAWAYLQEQPDGDLGVHVDLPPGGCPARLGTAEHPYTTKEWEAPPLAGVIRDATALDGGPEWTERVAWEGEQPGRRIVVAWPRLGTRRDDLYFASGVNIAEPTPVTSSADDYAQVVIALGAGDGSAKVRAVDAVRDGRLRLEHVLDRPSVTDPAALTQIARTERARRQQPATVDEITVVDHPAAPIGSWSVGDDVRVSIHDQWADFDAWCRITAWTLHPAEGDKPEAATLRLDRPYTTGA